MQTCPNCGQEGGGNFCAHCGQRRGERRISMRQLLADAIEDQLSLNAALPRTLRALLFKPGFLTAEYTAGRVQRYIPPFRLYLACSVLFFLVLSFESTRRPDFQMSITIGGRTAVEAKQDTLRAREALDSIAAGRNAVFRTGWADFDSTANRRVRELAAMPLDQMRSSINRAMIQRAPTALFILLPVFALLLKFLYFRTGRYYVEHFVFALHTHAFVFLVFTPALIVPGIIGAIATAWYMIYSLLAFKRYYAQSDALTVVKWFTAAFCYMIILSFGMVAMLAVAVVLS